MSIHIKGQWPYYPSFVNLWQSNGEVALTFDKDAIWEKYNRSLNETNLFTIVTEIMQEVSAAVALLLRKTLPGGWLLMNIPYFEQQLHDLTTEFIVIYKRVRKWLCLWLDNPKITNSVLLTKTTGIRACTTNWRASVDCSNQFSFLADNLQHGKSIQPGLEAKCWKR